MEKECSRAIMNMCSENELYKRCSTVVCQNGKVKEMNVCDERFGMSISEGSGL